MNVMRHEDVLTVLKDLLYSHIDLANYLEYVFDFRISYEMACSINISELTSTEIDENANSTPAGSSLSELEFYSRRRLLLERCNGDKILETKFSKVKKAWSTILGLRERFPDLFEFRFLCHAEEMGDERIHEIMQGTSKLIYFLPNEKYAESLFITATLQTLAKIQNKFIQENPSQFFRANFSKPSKMGVQGASKSDIVELASPLLEVLNRCSYSNLKFGKDGELVWNIDMIERELSIELF